MYFEGKLPPEQLENRFDVVAALDSGGGERGEGDDVVVSSPTKVGPGHCCSPRQIGLSKGR